MARIFAAQYRPAIANGNRGSTHKISETRVARAHQAPHDAKHHQYHDRVTEPEMVLEVFDAQAMCCISAEHGEHQQPMEDAYRQVPDAARLNRWWLCCWRLFAAHMRLETT